MINTKEEAVTALREVGETLVSLADFLSGDQRQQPREEPARVEPAREPVKAGPDVEEVRAALAAKASAGFTADVRELLERHGASRLSEVDPSEYQAIMDELVKIGER